MSNQFVKDAIRTEAHPGLSPFTPNQILGFIAFIEHTGVIADAIKRAIYYGKHPDQSQLGKLSHCADEISNLANDIVELLRPVDVSDKMYGFDIPPRLLHGALGIVSEVGEIAEQLHAHALGGKLDRVNIGEENFDIDWYQAIIQDELDLDEREIRAAGIEKLRARFPDKFTQGAALNRDLVKERDILEGGIK